MAGINDLLNRLRKTVFGNSQINDLQAVSNVIDNVKTKLPDNIKNYLDYQFIFDKNTLDLAGTIERELDGIQPDQTRLNRYKEYKSIYKRIPYVSRAISVLVDNILSPDDYTKKVLTFNEVDRKLEKDVEFVKKFIVKKFGLDIIASKIIRNTLLFGDYFVEIVDESTIVKLGTILLRDDVNFVKNLDTLDIDLDIKNYLNTQLQKLLLTEGIDLELSTIPKPQNLLNENDDNKTSRRDFKIKLDYHWPGNVIILGTKDIVLGYLVFPDLNTSVYANRITNTSVVANIQNYVPGSVSFFNSFDAQKSQLSTFVSDLSDKILHRIINGIKEKTGKDMDMKEIIKHTSPSLTDMIFTLIQATLASRGNLDGLSTVRFVPVHKMVHFKIAKEDDFTPYGTSLLYGLEYLARAIIAMEAAILLYRVTRSVDRRVYHVEVGSSRDVQTPIQQVIRALTRRRFAVNDPGIGVDEIPSNIGAYEEIFLPMKNGKRFMEVDSLPSGQMNITMDDWRELRNELIAGLGVPASYVGREEDYELKATLSNENIIFAQTIINYQVIFSEAFTELIHKVYKLMTMENLNEEIRIVFKPPIKLLLEKYSDMAGQFSQLADVAKVAGINSKTLFNKFFGELMDEKDIKKTRLDQISKDLLNLNQTGDENDNDMGGGFGGGGGGGGLF